MRHQDLPNLDPATYLADIIRAKHLTTRALLLAVEQDLRLLYADYDAAAVNMQSLPVSHWEGELKAALLSCYDSNTVPLSTLKDDILRSLRATSEVNLQRCAYCMLNDPRTWDHYFPKDFYPEYSVYHANLVYVCFGCNHRKAAHYSEHRLHYCHPYFTVHEVEPLLHCTVNVAQDVLSVDYYGAGLGNLVMAGEIVEQHISDLNLRERFRAEAASLVSSLIGDLRLHFPAGVQPDVLRRVLEVRFVEAQAQLGSNAWDARLWHGLAACEAFLDYANRKILSANVPSRNGFDTPAPPRT